MRFAFDDFAHADVALHKRLQLLAEPGVATARRCRCSRLLATFVIVTTFLASCGSLCSLLSLLLLLAALLGLRGPSIGFGGGLGFLLLLRSRWLCLLLVFRGGCGLLGRCTSAGVGVRC